MCSRPILISQPHECAGTGWPIPAKGASLTIPTIVCHNHADLRALLTQALGEDRRHRIEQRGDERQRDAQRPCRTGLRMRNHQPAGQHDAKKRAKHPQDLFERMRCAP